MKTKDIVTIASVALGTATLTVLTFWPGSLDAGNETEALAAKIAKPKLVANGVEMTLAAADGRTFAAGDEPAFDLHAANTTDESATVAVCVGMTGSSPADERSRVLRLPSQLWQHQQTLVLKPRETKAVKLIAQVKLPAGQMITVSLQAVDPPKEAAATANQRIGSSFAGRSSGNVRPIWGAAANPKAGSLLQDAPVSQPGIVALTFSTVTPAAPPALAAVR